MTDLKNPPCSELANPELDTSSDDQEEHFSLSSEDEQQSTEDPITKRRSSLQTLRFRAQKHLVGRIVNNRQSIKPLIGESAYTALKQFENVLKCHNTNQKEVKALMGSVVKTIGKLGVVAKQRDLTEEQLVLARTAKQQFYKIALTIISFVRTDYTYNQAYLSQMLRDCEQTLCECVTEMLSSKSVGRINNVFGTLCEPRLMDSLFSLNATAEQRNSLLELTTSLESMVANRRT